MKEKINLPHGHHDPNAQSHIMEAMPAEETVRIVADALGQLGDPSRLRIFWLLCHTEECVADVAAYVRMSSPAVSHHLRLLKAAGLIVSRRDGKEMLYRAADSELVDELHRIVERIAEISCPASN
jgi:DNA-binding transcriptional ArsR family regulator